MLALPVLALLTLGSPSQGHEVGANDPGPADSDPAAVVQEPELPGELEVRLRAIAEARSAGDLEDARELLRETITGLDAFGLASDVQRIQALGELKTATVDLSCLPEQADVIELCIETLTRMHSAEHETVLAAQMEFAGVVDRLGDSVRAREISEQVLALRERLLAPDDRSLLRTKETIAVTNIRTGDVAKGMESLEEILAVWEEAYPEDRWDLIRLRETRATVHIMQGDVVRGAREYEEIIVALVEHYPDDVQVILSARSNLGIARFYLGDLEGARSVLEEVYAARRATLPEDHPDLVDSMVNLSGIRPALGDFSGAREMAERSLELLLRRLPPDHPDVLGAKHNLANALGVVGDDQSALELQEEVLRARSEHRSPTHSSVLDAKQSLANSKFRLGDFEGAAQLQAEVLEAREARLPPEHMELMETRGSYAGTLLALGEHDRARAQIATALSTWEQLVPPHDLKLLKLRQLLVSIDIARGDELYPRRELRKILSALSAMGLELRSLSPRSARDKGVFGLVHLQFALYLAEACGAAEELAPEFLAALETLRAASGSSATTLHALKGRPQLQATQAAIAQARSELEDLVYSPPKTSRRLEEWRSRLIELGEQRDRLEEAFRAELAEQGLLLGAIDAGGIAARLREDEVAVSYYVYTTDPESMTGPSHGGPHTSADHTHESEAMLAFVVRPDAAVTLLELGPAAEIADLVEAWRAAVGQAAVGRGIGLVAEEGADPAEPGERLRARVLDPVLAAAGEARSLYVVPDEALFLLPLDALPRGDGCVGDEYAVRTESSFHGLYAGDRAPAESEPRLLVVGAIDYGARTGSAGGTFAGAATPPVDESVHTSMIPLPATAAEIEALAALFRETVSSEPVVLRGAGATKAAFAEHAPEATYLHLATHGWFARDPLRSYLDAPPDLSLFTREVLQGYAPETLCGIALSGAALGRDAAGRVPGILTAEELATLDLTNCELAVLSACETNVGIRRAGQGIQSLQVALHTAGARTAITSLWKVDDAATRRLMELFYTKLWQDGLGKADALWQAKMALREEGYPLRDWAGWVLSGDPN